MLFVIDIFLSISILSSNAPHPSFKLICFFISSPEVKPHAGDSNGKGKGVGRDASDGEREKSQGVRH